MADTTITSGKINTLDYSKIVDSDGNARFAEGDLATRSITGITYSYGKWSLSGTHLMLVVSITATEDATIASWAEIAQASVPSYILNKIVPPFGSNITRNDFYGYNGGLEKSSTSINCYIEKRDGTLYIRSFLENTLTANFNYRVQFDLLID